MNGNERKFECTFNSCSLTFFILFFYAFNVGSNDLIMLSSSASGWYHSASFYDFQMFIERYTF